MNNNCCRLNYNLINDVFDRQVFRYAVLCFDCTYKTHLKTINFLNIDIKIQNL